MTKGFMILTTGDNRYFKLATHLIKPNKLSAYCPPLFSILTNCHNKYVEQSDAVNVLQSANSFYPVQFNGLYEETLFIDGDCFFDDDLNYYPPITYCTCTK